jgi:hypothetical protein
MIRGGKGMSSYKEIQPYIGNENQLIGYQEAVLSDGMSEGVRVMRVDNGGNLSASVLPGRCMDLLQVRYKGKNMNYLAPQGVRNAEFYEAGDAHFLRNFFVGQLTTGGLQNIGVPKDVYGETRGLHGRIDNIPAENVSYERTLVKGVPGLSVKGTMKEARLFGENLTLERKLAFAYEDDSITITDRVTNCGFGRRQFGLLYHLNYGYPLLQDGTRIIIDSEEVTPRTPEAAKYAGTWNVIEAPEYPYPERCYFHKIKPDRKGKCSYTVFNDKLAVGVRVEFDAKELPYFCEWKMLGKGEYVLGMEPMNMFMDGPAVGEKGCMAPVLAAGGSKTYTVKLTYIDRV